MITINSVRWNQTVDDLQASLQQPYQESSVKLAIVRYHRPQLSESNALLLMSGLSKLLLSMSAVQSRNPQEKKCMLKSSAWTVRDPHHLTLRLVGLNNFTIHIIQGRGENGVKRAILQIKIMQKYTIHKYNKTGSWSTILLKNYETYAAPMTSIHEFIS